MNSLFVSVNYCFYDEVDKEIKKSSAWQSWKILWWIFINLDISNTLTTRRTLRACEEIFHLYSILFSSFNIAFASRSRLFKSTPHSKNKIHCELLSIAMKFHYFDNNCVTLFLSLIDLSLSE